MFRSGSSGHLPKRRKEDFDSLISSCQSSDQRSMVARAIDKSVLAEVSEYSFKSSAKSFAEIGLGNKSVISSMNKIKSKGPKTEPWGTPLRTEEVFEKWWSTMTVCHLPVRNSSINSIPLFLYSTPAPNSLFLCKSFTIVRYTFSTLSFPSARRITVWFDKDIQTKPANKNPEGISAYRQRILNKNHEKTSYFVVPDF